MAINKTAKNITIELKGKYTSNVGNLTKTAQLVNVESTKENLTLSSNKKVVSQGKI